MARIRTIKPEFWASEQIVECSPNARLLFIGLWTFSDDNGIHPASIRRLKLEVFPADDFAQQDVADMVGELIQQGLLVEYSVNGTAYWRITGWHKHQRIEKPTFRHPLPDGAVPATAERHLDDGSPNGRRNNREGSPSERKGEEGNGREPKKKSNTASPPAAADQRASTYDFKADLFARWKALPDGGGGAFLNKLFRDYPEQRVIEAVERTLEETRADPKAFVIGLLQKKLDRDHLRTPLDDDSCYAALAAQDWSGYL